MYEQDLQNKLESLENEVLSLKTQIKLMNKPKSVRNEILKFIASFLMLSFIWGVFMGSASALVEDMTKDIITDIQQIKEFKDATIEKYNNQDDAIYEIVDQMKNKDAEIADLYHGFELVGITLAQIMAKIPN